MKRILLGFILLASAAFGQSFPVKSDNTGAVNEPSGFWAANAAAIANALGYTGGVIPGSLGGTGVANTGKTITIGGNLTLSGAYALTFTQTGVTNVTLPTTGTLATLAGVETWTNKTLTSPILTTPTLGVASSTNETITGTTGSGYITLPSQSLAPSAPTTGNLRIYSDSSNKFAWIGASGYTRSFDGALTASRIFTLPDANTNFPVFGQTITFTGPTAARTVAMPDANFTIARTDAANTFMGTQTFGAVVGTSWNGNTWATGTGTLVIGAGKTFTSSNTLTLAGTDASTLNIGTGGTLGTGAFQPQTVLTGTAGQVAVSNSGVGATTLSLPTAITGVNSVTSAALSNFVLGTGTSGVFFTAASADNTSLLQSATVNGLSQVLTLKESYNGSSADIPALAFNVSTIGEAAGNKAGLGLIRNQVNGRGRLAFFLNSANTTAAFTSSDEVMGIDYGSTSIPKWTFNTGGVQPGSTNTVLTLYLNAAEGGQETVVGTGGGFVLNALQGGGAKIYSVTGAVGSEVSVQQLLINSTGLTVSNSILGSGGSIPTNTTSGSNQFTNGAAFNNAIFGTTANFSGVVTFTANPNITTATTQTLGMGSVNTLSRNAGTGTTTITTNAGSLILQSGASVTFLTGDSSQNTTLAGNLTVSGILASVGTVNSSTSATLAFGVAAGSTATPDYSKISFRTFDASERGYIRLGDKVQNTARNQVEIAAMAADSGTLATIFSVDGSATTGAGFITVSGTGTSTFAGAVQLSNGTFASPALNFASATTSGFYRANTNSIGITNNGIASGYIDGISGSGGLFIASLGAGITLSPASGTGITLGGATNPTVVGGNFTVSGTANQFAGQTGFGGAGTATSVIRLLGSATAGTSQLGADIQPTFTSTATTAGSAVSALVQTQAAAFTMTNAYVYHAVNAVIGAGSAITNQYGLYVDTLGGASNNYAIYTNTGAVRLGDNVTVIGATILQNSATDAFLQMSRASTSRTTQIQFQTAGVSDWQIYTTGASPDIRFYNGTDRFKLNSTYADFTGITTIGTSTTAAAILGVSEGLTGALWVGGTLNVAGVITAQNSFNYFGPQTNRNNGVIVARSDQNQVSLISLENASAGTAAKASVFADNGSYTTELTTIGTGFTTAGKYVASTGLLESNAGNGLVISSLNSSIRFWTGNTGALSATVSSSDQSWTFAAAILAGTYVNHHNYVVSGLPSAATAGAGSLAFVTDSTATAITGLGLTVVGSGTNKVFVYSDGTNWLIL